jgi:hypothetical protein
VRSVFFYEYDLGASWMHEVRIERSLNQARANSTRGVWPARAPRHQGFAVVLGSTYRDWLAEFAYRESMDDEPLDFDPEQFDCDAVNATLRQPDLWAIRFG